MIKSIILIMMDCLGRHQVSKYVAGGGGGAVAVLARKFNDASQKETFIWAKRNCKFVTQHLLETPLYTNTGIH
jgi:hypothetical protein